MHVHNAPSGLAFTIVNQLVHASRDVHFSQNLIINSQATTY